MSIIESIRVFGTGDNAPGVQVREVVTGQPPSTTLVGTVAMEGILKRGPMGVWVPVRNRTQYEQIFGNPSDPTWHLYDTPESKGMPDAVEGFFLNANDTGVLWALRNQLDGGAKRAEQIFYSRKDHTFPVLKVKAANEGRWGGKRQPTVKSVVFSVEANTFVIEKPDTNTNELVGAKVSFKSGDQPESEVFTIESNTKSTENGAVTCYLKPGIDLLGLGLDTTEALSGTLTYEPWITISGGTFSFSRKRTLSGTVDLDYSANSGALVVDIGTNPVGGSVVVKGTDTSFTTELRVGDSLWIGEEKRKILTVWNDTLVSVESRFKYATGSGLTVETDNRVVRSDDPATNTIDLTTINPGHIISEANNGTHPDIYHVRYWDSTINSYRYGWNGYRSGDKNIIFNRNDATIFPVEFTERTLQYCNYWAEGEATDFVSELTPKEDRLLDPRYPFRSVSVREVDASSTPERVRIWGGLYGFQQDEEILKLPTVATISLAAPLGDGLTVNFGNGSRYPDTHFSMEVSFQGKVVFNVPDASLNPSDPLFVDLAINDANIAYQDDSVKVYRWVEVESLLQGEYTVLEGNDVRPANASIELLDFDDARKTIHYINASDYKFLPQATKVFIDPYADPRRFSRIVGDVRASLYFDAETDEGRKFAVRSVDGINILRHFGDLDFTKYYSVGDFFYDVVSKEAVEISRVTVGQLTLVSPLAAGSIPNNSSLLIPGKFALNDTDYAHIKERELGSKLFLQYNTDLEGGTEGDDLNVPSSYHTRYFDLTENSLEKAVLGKNQGMIRIAIPGVYDVSVQLAALNYAASKAYEFRVEVPPYIRDAIAVENFVLRELGRSDFATIAFPSYGTVRDPRTGGFRQVSLSGDIMGLETIRAAAIKGYHNVAAGISAQLRRVVKLPLYLDPFDDEGLLTQVGVQPITRKSGLVVIFGARVPAENPVYNFVHVRRNQSQYIRTFAESPQLYSMLFKMRTSNWDQTVMLFLRRFFEAEFRKGALNNRLSFGQAVRIEPGSSTGGPIGFNPDVEDVYLSEHKGVIYLNISYQPAEMVERIVLTVSPDSVTSTVIA